MALMKNPPLPEKFRIYIFTPYTDYKLTLL